MDRSSLNEESTNRKLTQLSSNLGGRLQTQQASQYMSDQILTTVEGWDVRLYHFLVWPLEFIIWNVTFC